MISKEREYELIETVRKKISESPYLSHMKDDILENEIETTLEGELQKTEFCSITQKVDIVRKVYSSIRGLGVLDSIMKDNSITEVMVNGPDNIFIEKNGKVIKSREKFENEERLRGVINRIVGESKREVNDAVPIVDTTLEDGSRVNVVLPPVSLVGPVITIRKFSRNPMTIEQLIKYGSITPDIAEVLKDFVEAKYNIFIAGGTGSGKTTFLNALSNYIPGDERIITIEDSAELQIVNIDNLVKLQTKNSNSTGKGEITITQLIKSSLRMRPDRIIVGEVRGGEALDMLQAMNTGHDGSLSTGHANSAQDMMNRLETMVIQGGSGMPTEAIRRQIVSSLDIIIYLSRMRDRSRKTIEISEVCDINADGTIRLNPLYLFEEDTESTLDHVSGQLKRTSNKMENTDKLLKAGKQIRF